MWLIGVPLFYALNLWIMRTSEPVGTKASKVTAFLFSFVTWTYAVMGLLLVDAFPSHLWFVLIAWVIVGYIVLFVGLIRRRRLRSSFGTGFDPKGGVAPPS
jgi:hypothetical protein